MDGAHILENLQCPAYKVASGDITHLPLIQAFAATHKPVIMSTGGATLDDCRVAIDCILNENADAQGCGESQVDSDQDGVPNINDECPNTLQNENADSKGCGESQIDSDSDGTPDVIDNSDPDTLKVIDELSVSTSVAVTVPIEV